MKRFFAVVCVFVFSLIVSVSAFAEQSASPVVVEETADSSAAITQGNLGLMVGGGQGGMGTQEVNDNSFIYLGAYFETGKFAGPMSWRFSANFFNYVENFEEPYSSSTGGHTLKVNTYRFMTGPSFQADFENGWWVWDSFQVGTDWEDAEGFSPPVVVQNELMFGSGFFYNYLIANSRITSQEEYQSVYLADQMFFRLTNYLAVGPEIKYTWFNQYDDLGEASMVYEWAAGGMVRISENKLDPRWSVTAGYTQGDFVGGSWHADFWVKF